MSRMNKYLKELKKELDKNGVQDQEEILEKYRKRYEFALEADINEDEIEEMLGKPSDVALKYVVEPDADKSSEADEIEANYQNGYNLVVRTVNDDIVIKCSKDDKNHIFLEDIDEENYEVLADSQKGVIVSYRKSKYLSLNRRKKGVITIAIPKGKVFDQAVISGGSSDLQAVDLAAKRINLQFVSGDVEIHELDADLTKVSVVSGDVDIYRIAGKEVTLNTVSGDIKIDYIDANSLRVDTVSGDVTVESYDGELKTSSISGDIKVNGVYSGTLKNTLKGIFRK